MSEYLTNNSDHSLVLVSDDLTLHLNSTNHKASFKGLPAEEYPTLPAAKAQVSVTLPADELSAVLANVLFAAAVDDTRPVLGGLLWRFTETSLELVGTDGYRLAYTKMPNPGTIVGDYVIPRRAIQELIRIGEGKAIEIAFAGSQAVFTSGATKLTSRILEGKFPDFAAILPKKKVIQATLAASAFSRSLKLASLFSRDAAYSTKLSVEGAKLLIEAASVQLGENQNEVALERPVEQSLTISANAQYLIEALAHINGTVALELVDHKSPIVLRPVQGKTETLYLVMPLRNE
jgi:DNA polymerase-3 subunit beta